MLIHPAVDVSSAVEDAPDEIVVVEHRRPLGRRTKILIVTVVVALAGGGVWWHHTVTENPGLEFYGGPNVYRDTAADDNSGIRRVRNLLGEEVDIDFVPDGALYVSFGLYNGGQHDVRIEAVPEAKMYYWAFERMSVGTDPDDGFVGFDSHYAPLRPFTLQRGETREVRLEFRIAGCDPAGLQPGGSSSIRGLPLRYRTFGITRTHDVPFRDAAIALQAMGICDHPLPNGS